jgi:hypothetical protein
MGQIPFDRLPEDGDIEMVTALQVLGGIDQVVAADASDLEKDPPGQAKVLLGESLFLDDAGVAVEDPKAVPQDELEGGTGCLGDVVENNHIWFNRDTKVIKHAYREANELMFLGIKSYRFFDIILNFAPH